MFERVAECDDCSIKHGNSALEAVMQILEIILVSSAFISGLAMPLFPSPHVREGSQKAIWTFALALGIYVLFLAICTMLPNYLMLVFASLASMGAGYAGGAFIVKERVNTAVKHTAPSGKAQTAS
jgi:hypothetical protein